MTELRRMVSWWWQLEAKFKGVTFQGRATFIGRPVVTMARGGQIILGDGVVLASAQRANPLGNFQPCFIRAWAAGAKVVVGERVGLSSTVLCAAVGIEVGAGTIFGAGALVVDNDFHTRGPSGEWTETGAGTARPVKIGRRVFVGARAIILKGVTIGDDAIIGAGAVVTRDVPPGHTAVGNPARNFPSKARPADRPN
jgi:acetyltransferase-like isoleucine patch superfamily enzyme